MSPTKIKIPRKRVPRGDNASFVYSFTQEGQNNVELRFYKSRMKTLFQVFKGYDVREWGLDVEVPKGNRPMVELIFKTDDPNSRLYFTRFMESELFSHFQKVEYYGDIAYFGCFTKKTKLIKIVRTLLKDIYKFELDDVNVVLSKT